MSYWRRWTTTSSSCQATPTNYFMKLKSKIHSLITSPPTSGSSLTALRESISRISRQMFMGTCILLSMSKICLIQWQNTSRRTLGSCSLMTLKLRWWKATMGEKMKRKTRYRMRSTSRRKKRRQRVCSSITTITSTWGKNTKQIWSPTYFSLLLKLLTSFYL